MTIYKARWHDAFHCLAGDCPDTCCQAWEVPVDEATANYYRTLSGELGEKLRSVMQPDEEGELCLQLQGGFCPLLEESGLCRVMRELGEDKVSETCRSHPRFCHEYGEHQELGLCASCPECARLVLENDLDLLKEEGDEPPVEETPEHLRELLRAREAAWDLLRRRELPLARRLDALLWCSDEVDVLLEEDQGEEMWAGLLEWMDQGDIPALPAQDDPREVLSELVGYLTQLEPLKPDWHDLLRQALAEWDGGSLAVPGLLGERAACYFLHRQWLRSAWMGQTLPWAEFAVLGVAVASLLAPKLGWQESFRRFCLELEHSDDNMAAMEEISQELVSIEGFASVAGIIKEG